MTSTAVTDEQIRSIGTDEITDLAIGCTVLAAGGGGMPRLGEVMARYAIESIGAVDLVTLDDLDPAGIVLPCGMIGAPTVMTEKIPNGEESRVIRERLEPLLSAEIVALMPLEMGGINGVLPAAFAAYAGLPLVDGDLMGRAFPQLEMCTPHLYGIPSWPLVLADERLQTVVVESLDNVWAEKLARNLVSTFGGCGTSALYPMTVETARQPVIAGTVSDAIRVGEAIRTAADDPFVALASRVPTFVILQGKVVDVERRTAGGFVRGSAIVEGVAADAGRTIRIEFQNENLVVLEEGEVLVTVPDIITLLDTHTAHGIVTEQISYGQRVTVAAFPAPVQWTSEAGLAVVGPRAFGYECDYEPVQERYDPLS